MGKFQSTVSAIQEHPVRSVLVGGGFATMLATIQYWVPNRGEVFEFGLLNGVFCLGALAFGLGVIGEFLAGWFSEHVAWRFARRQPIAQHSPALPESSSNPDLVEPDIGLLEVARRIARREGELPTDRAEQEKLTDKINREIASKVKFKNLTVYGCQGTQAPEVLSQSWRWASANVDVVKERVWFPGSWGSIDYGHIMFVSSEVDEVWPPIPVDED